MDLDLIFLSLGIEGLFSLFFRRSTHLHYRLDGVWKDGNLSGGTYMSLADANEVSDTSTTKLPYLELQDPEDVISNIKDI